MKLNMSVFYDWLSEFHPTADIHSDAIEIDTVRLFSNNIVPKENCLYIGRMKDLFVNGSDKVICTHNNDILILETNDQEEVLNSVLNAFEFYSKWDERLIQLLSSGSMLQDFLNASEEILKHPLFMLDAGQRLLAISQNYPLGSVDEHWDRFLLKGSSTMEMILFLNQSNPERFSKKGVHFLGKDTGMPNDGYHYNFFVQDKWVGKICLVTKNIVISKGDLCLFQLLCTRIEAWFSSHIQELEAIQLDRLLCSAMANDGGNQEELIRLLNIRGWKSQDKLLLIQLHAPYQPFNINSHFCRMLNHQFSSMYAVNFHYGICMICNLSLESQNQLMDRLLPMLYTSKYYGVISQLFTLEDSFHKQYLYTEITGEYCEKEIGKLYNGEKYILNYVLHQMTQQTNADLVHPALRKLIAYDQVHDTDFANTLKVYLSTERRNLETAKELNLHRNSLSYRLHKLEELLDVDLDDADIRMHLLLSFHFLSI